MKNSMTLFKEDIYGCNGINLVTPSVSGIDFTVGNTISNKNENVVQSFSDYLKKRHKTGG